MKYIQSGINPEVLILVKEESFDKQQLQEYYLNHINKDCIVYPIQTKKVTPISMAKDYLSCLKEDISHLNIKIIYVCHAVYFKALLKNNQKIDKQIGYIFPCKLEGYKPYYMLYGIDYRTLFYNPDQQAILTNTLSVLNNWFNGIDSTPGHAFKPVIYSPRRSDKIKEILTYCLNRKALTCDCEGRSLRFHESGLETLAFGFTEYSSVSFPVDRSSFDRLAIKSLLKQFFEKYTGKLIYHNANYDIKVLIYNLFMKDQNDYKGLVYGLNVLTRNIEDTKIISYLALNSTNRTKLDLKTLSHEFTGNYALDVSTITKIEDKDLLQYNGMDTMATWYVYYKYKPILIKDKQLHIYKHLFIPSLKNIIHTEMNGMPLKLENILEADNYLQKIQKDTLGILFSNQFITDYQNKLRYKEYEECNAKWKKKRKPLEYFNYVEFNPNSNKQLQELLFEDMALPILDFTANYQPSTDKQHLNKLIHKCKTSEQKEIIQCLLDLSEVNTLLSNFIHSFKEKTIFKDNRHWLHGNFNIGGTVSGRLSGSNPNLQQLPSTGNKHASVLKKCFVAPDGWLLAGFDFNALEAKIDALLSQDPNKLKIYTEGYDSHSLKTYTYWPNECKGIDPDNVNSINSIKTKYPALRFKSKGISFALQYQGTYMTLMDQGFSEEEAKQIENAYHELYKHSDDFINKRINKASKDGYISVAFGLRIRTPIINKSLLNNKKTPYKALKEIRTIANAISQSYGLLNNRAANEFHKILLNSKYKYDIKPICHIHDAQYYLIRNDLDIVHWFNTELIKCTEWQKLGELNHKQIKLNGEVDLFYPDWTTGYTLPNNATKEEIRRICNGK